jgi:nicotinamidase-related amidase
VTTPDLTRFALVVVDAQKGFDDPWWGPRNNPDCDVNIAALVGRWAEQARPLVYVRHDSQNPESPLFAGSAGNRLKEYLSAEPDLLVQQTGAEGIVVCGITTNHCCETTARVGGNLGHHVLFAVDATHTFDRTGPDGDTVSADELARVTATNLHGEFADVVRTEDLLR